MRGPPSKEEIVSPSDGSLAVAVTLPDRSAGKEHCETFVQLGSKLGDGCVSERDVNAVRDSRSDTVGFCRGSVLRLLSCSFQCGGNGGVIKCRPSDVAHHMLENESEIDTSLRADSVVISSLASDYDTWNVRV